MDKVLLIDGLNFLWRANIAFGSKTMEHSLDKECWGPKHTEPLCLCGSKWDTDESFCYGLRYSIVYVFFRNLKALIAQFEPDAIFFCLEGANNFRYGLFPEYKANRIIKNASKQEEKDRFNGQRDIVVSLLSHLPITIASADGYEADDVIASLVEDLKEEEVIIVSGDTDFIQLLQKGYQNLKLYNPSEKEFREAPDYPYVAWKCCRGDASDNIPGLPKIGEVRALKLMRDPQALQACLSIEENRSLFNLNRELIELKIIPLEQLSLLGFQLNLEALKTEFATMKLEGITSEPYWSKFVETFAL